MTVAEIQEFIKKQIEKYDEIPNEHQDAKFKQATADLVIVLGMLDELEPKEEWTDIEKSLECLRVEMLNLPTDFDKTVADDHLESLRYIFITQFKENNK